VENKYINKINVQTRRNCYRASTRVTNGGREIVCQSMATDSRLGAGMGKVQCCRCAGVAVLPAADRYVVVGQYAAAPYGLGGQADGLDALALSPDPHCAVFPGAHKVWEGGEGRRGGRADPKTAVTITQLAHCRKALRGII